MTKLLWFTLAALALQAKTVVTEKPVGRAPDGSALVLYELKGEKIEATVRNYGARLVTLKVPGRAGKLGDVVLGFDDPMLYLGPNPVFGATVGRYANRIAGGAFKLGDRTYTLPKNNSGNTLHGGLQGFDKRFWTGKIQGEALVLTYMSKDGEEGFPGNLTVTVKYSLEGSALRIDYSATSDADTVLNLTNHSYFNLAGEGDVLSHELTVAADRFLPADKGLIPTGELRNVAGTPFDFRTPHRIGERISQDDEQLKTGGGYDHTFVLNSGGRSLQLAAKVKDPASGRVMEALTTEPGVQVYTSNNLRNGTPGKGGKNYGRYGALCLETQHFPDSPNRPAFPSTVLKKGKRFQSATVFRFSVE